MKRIALLAVLPVLCFCFVLSAQAQITVFYPAALFSDEPDRYGNVYSIGPMNAIQETDIAELPLDYFYEDDNLWNVWNYLGIRMLISHAPSFGEDAPELTATITSAFPARYEVILNFLENNTEPGTGPILAALGDDELQLYDDSNSVRATGGTTPQYPVFGSFAGNAWWYSVSLGEVDVDAGGVITIRIDDTPSHEFDIVATSEVANVFQGITLRILEFQGPLPEIQINPGVFEWREDLVGNRFRTWAADEAAYPSLEDWLTINSRQDGSGLWNIRERLGPYGPILESFPGSGNDAMPLRTSVIFAFGGEYEVFLNIGGTADPAGEQHNPLSFGVEGQEQIYLPHDGVFIDIPGYNNFEVSTGSITVADGEQIDFIIDDVQASDYPEVQRSVYLGIRMVLISDDTAVKNWALY